MASLRERFRAWLHRRIADPDWQRWAAAFPLTRPLAQKRTRALFDLCAGFVYSQTLYACVQVDLFERLRGGPRTVSELAPALGLSGAAALRLFRAAASLQLLEALPNDRWALADLGAAMLGNPAIGDFVAHHALLYDDLRDPVALLRGEVETSLAQFWPYAERRPDAPQRVADEKRRQAYEGYCALMSRSQALIADDVLDAWPTHRHRCWLDVGGGEGAFVAAAAARTTVTRFQLFELPEVAARAQAAMVAQGLTERVDVFAGDFLADSLPKGADIVSLVRVLHDHDDESALALLSRIRDALPQGGTLLIAEPMAQTRGAEPVGDAYFGLYLLAMGRGRARSAREIAALAGRSGFVDCQLLKMLRPLLASALMARRV